MENWAERERVLRAEGVCARRLDVQYVSVIVCFRSLCLADPDFGSSPSVLTQDTETCRPAAVCPVSCSVPTSHISHLASPVFIISTLKCVVADIDPWSLLSFCCGGYPL